MTKPAVTQEALDRIEETLRRELDSFKLLMNERQTETHRRLETLNNAHDKAILEKQRTDEAATRIQERAVTKADLQIWRDEVERRLNTMAGMAAVRATVLATAISIVVGLTVVLVGRYLAQ